MEQEELVLSGNFASGIMYRANRWTASASRAIRESTLRSDQVSFYQLLHREKYAGFMEEVAFGTFGRLCRVRCFLCWLAWSNKVC